MKRQQRRAKKVAPAPPAPKYNPPIRYARLQILQNIARAQHLIREPNAQLPEEIKENLQEEWWQLVDEAMKVLDKRLTCKVCRRIHEAPEATKMAEALRAEMDAEDAEEIDEDGVERWQDKFEETEKAYEEEMVLGECGETAAGPESPSVL